MKEKCYVISFPTRKHVELGNGRSYDMYGNIEYPIDDDQLSAIKKILEAGDSKEELKVVEEKITVNGQILHIK